ncbi:MAG: aminotransferase class V-fold PLP-dependent enzyme [Acidimicrobiia bacterium]
MNTLTRRGFLSSSGHAMLADAAAACWADTSAASPAAPAVLQGLEVPRFDPAVARDENFWLLLRQEFNLRDRMIWMNNGTFGPPSRNVTELHDRVMHEQAADPTDNYRFAARDRVRAQAARFINATSDEVALTRSTTEGVSTFASGLDWRRGDEVVMTTHEHMGGFGPFRTLEERHGIRIRWIELPLPPVSGDQIVDLYRRAINRRTRLLFASHVVYVNGLRMPVQQIAEMAHERGLLCSVDGAHALGMIPVDVTALRCDHYAASGHKWLMAGAGTGLFFLRRSLIPAVWPLTGWPEPGTSQVDTARKYEVCGQRHVASAISMSAAFSLQDAVGTQTIEARVMELSAQLRHGLASIPGVRLYSPLERELGSGLTTFAVEGLSGENLAALLMIRHNIRCLRLPDDEPPTVNWHAIRLTTHIYNMPGDVELVLSTVREGAANPGQYTALKRPSIT